MVLQEDPTNCHPKKREISNLLDVSHEHVEDVQYLLSRKGLLGAQARDYGSRRIYTLLVWDVEMSGECGESISYRNLHREHIVVQ